jgi:hypothetical protein
MGGHGSMQPSQGRVQPSNNLQLYRLHNDIEVPSFVLSGEPNLWFGRIVSPAAERSAAPVSGGKSSMSNESCIDAPAVS